MTRLSPIWAAAVALLWLNPATSQVPLDKSLDTMQVGDGLQVELFAGEPMFSNPTSMDIDHKGRVWVCEAINYRQRLRGKPPIRKEGDRILVLEDTTGDGTADTVHTFYQAPEVESPLGIAVAPDPDGVGLKVYVCQSPHIWVFHDKDGDLKADGPPEVLLKGFGGIDHDHGVHGIMIGPDGKLYFTVGDGGVRDLQSSDGKGRKWTSNNTDCRAGTVWRCDMDGTNLELIAHNFRNNYEATVDSFGTIWLSDNDDDGTKQTRICYVMPGGDYGYHPRGKQYHHWHEDDPGVVHKVLRTGFGSPTGICFYEGTLLPEKYRGQLLHTDAGPREMRCYHITPKGAGYELEQEVMLTSKDNWFRPSDVCVAPDGSVFVADWYDPGVGGHGMGDTSRGRIWRVTPKGHQGYKVPKVDVSTPVGRVDALASPNLAVRHMALKYLPTLDEKAARATAAVAVQDDRLRILHPRLMWLIPRTESWKAMVKNIADLKEEKDAQLAVMSARVLDDFFYQIQDKEIFAYPEDFGTSPDTTWINSHPAFAPLARQYLLLMRKQAVEDMKPGFYFFAKKYTGDDHFYLAALNIACGIDPKRRELILADFDKHFPEWNDQVADLVWELRPPSVMPRLKKLLTDAKLTTEQRSRIVDLVAVSDASDAGQILLGAVTDADTPAPIREKALANLRTHLPGKWGNLRGSPEMTQAINQLLDDDTRIEAGLSLAAISGRAQTAAQISEMARDAARSLAVRRKAVSTLGELTSPPAVEGLKAIITSENPLRVDAVKALGRHLPTRGTGGTYEPAMNVLREVLTGKATPEMKQAAVEAVAASHEGGKWLLSAQQQKQLPEAVLADVGRFMRNTPFQDLRNAAMIAFPAPGKLDPSKLPSISQLATKRGNAERGRQLMLASLKNESQCMNCHQIRGVGGHIGPDLSMIGKKGSRENLFESILEPSKAIADQYIQYQVETTQGQLITGLLISETDDAVTLRTATGQDITIPTEDVLGKDKMKTSIMPENLVVTLSEEDLIDMVEYMTTLKTPALSFEEWQIVGPFPNGANDEGLDKDFGPEKSVDLKASYPGKDGRSVSWQTVRPDAAGYIDLQAFFAPGSSDITSYLYRTFESPVDQQAEILMGTDDGHRLWLNGELVSQTNAHRAAAPAQDRVKVKLKKGTNVVLLKIANGDGPHGLYFTIVSEEELKSTPDE